MASTGQNLSVELLDDRFHETGIDGTGSMLVDSSFETERGVVSWRRWRQTIEVAMNDEEIARLLTISRSRTEPASRVERAQMLLAYREKPSFFAVGGWACIIRRCNAASSGRWLMGR